MLKKPSVFWLFKILSKSSKSSWLTISSSPPRREHPQTGRAENAFSEGGERMVNQEDSFDLDKLLKSQKNAWLFQHLVELIVLLSDYGLQNPPEPWCFFDIFVSAQEMLENHRVFWLFDYGQECSRRRRGKGCSLRGAEEDMVNAFASRRGHPLRLRLLLHPWP